jgi:hypothetical protein
MEKFKDVLKKRMALVGGLNGLALVFISLSGVYGFMAADGSKDISDMIRGFQVGIFIALQIMVIVYFGMYYKALQSDEALKKLYIEENDERTKYIQDKIGGTGFNLIIGAMGTATVIAGFFNQTVFLTLLGALIFIVLIKGFLKLYYRFKY